MSTAMNDTQLRIAFDSIIRTAGPRGSVAVHQVMSQLGIDREKVAILADQLDYTTFYVDGSPFVGHYE